MTQLADCPKCEGRGFVVSGRDATPCECRNEWRSTLERAGVPPDHRDVPPDLPFPNPEIEGWRGDPWCMVFLPKVERDGTVPRPNGTGKTWLAVRVLGLWIQEGRQGPIEFASAAPISEVYIETTPGPVRFAHVAWAIENMRREIGTDSDATMRSLCSARFLVLDDWAAMRQTDYGRERMRLVIEHRSSHSLPTVITCDRPLEAVDSAGREVVEVRLASRIAKRSSSGASFVFEIDHETDRRTG